MQEKSCICVAKYINMSNYWSTRRRGKKKITPRS